MTIAEKILARQSGRSQVRPGDMVTVKVETCVLLDTLFTKHAGWRWPKKLHDPDKVVLVADHIVMSASPESAEGLQTMREVARYYGIKRVHDAGAGQGISHQVVADQAYALPGTVLANSDSHTVSAGALNCVARGLGRTELLNILCTGETWYRVAPTIRYELEGELPPGVTAKDTFLYLAGRWGSHENQNIEFGGPAQAQLSLDARRTLSTMCAEVSAEFALWAPDDKLISFVDSKTVRPYFPTWPDDDADYLEVRTINLSKLVPYVSGIDTVIHNTLPLEDFHDKVRIDQCVVGSCANGTVEDLKVVADILKGRQVAPWVRFFVTPGSQAIYREAAELGLLTTIAMAGAIVTPSACGACAAQDFGALAPGEVCLTATTRNYKGRMGASEAQIRIASPATVTASAVTGYITHPRDLEPATTAKASRA
jgi:3-isopropylmalate/(R)-2-methylmalate dehydratase large subunit